MELEIPTSEAMEKLGARIGALCSGGEVSECIGEIGARKTTFAKGFAHALGIEEEVQSPSYTISRVYVTESGRLLAHYDFYRLSDAGVMRSELQDSINDPQTITIIEWSEIISDVLPSDRLQITLNTLMGEEREVIIKASGPHSENIVERLT